jgi:protein arginine kinase activator
VLCEECKSKPASVHVTKIVNSKKVQQYLCQECARAKWEDLGFSMQPHLSVQNLLSGLVSAAQGASAGATPVTQLRCSNCGLAFSEFTRTGFLGCRQCYEQFDQELRPIYKRIHGDTEHRGKVPGRAGGRARVTREIDALRRELQECVRTEDYERAAELRDKIRALQEQLASSDENGGS